MIGIRQQFGNKMLKFGTGGRTMMGRLLFSAAALLCALFYTHAFGQTINATLGGTISDTSGALIPGVTVKATNSATGISSTAISNEAGTYQFASLQSGNYKVTAE